MTTVELSAPPGVWSDALHGPATLADHGQPVAIALPLATLRRLRTGGASLADLAERFGLSVADVAPLVHDPAHDQAGPVLRIAVGGDALAITASAAADIARRFDAAPYAIALGRLGAPHGLGRIEVAAVLAHQGRDPVGYTMADLERDLATLDGLRA